MPPGRRITGNTGANLLFGWDGNDTYLVDTPDDLISEATGGGTVIADLIGAGWYLNANTENLELRGTTPFGIGNALDNRLTDSDSANWLMGGAGHDTLEGRGGDDVLFGEAGADRFVFRPGSGADVIGDFVPGTDPIQLTSFGIADMPQLAACLLEDGGTTAIHLDGDLITLVGVARAASSAGDSVSAERQAGRKQAKAAVWQP